MWLTDSLGLSLGHPALSKVMVCVSCLCVGVAHAQICPVTTHFDLLYEEASKPFSRDC